MVSASRSVQLEGHRIAPVLEVAEEIAKVRVIDRFTGLVRDQVLLRHIGHIVALAVFGEQVVEGLIL